MSFQETSYQDYRFPSSQSLDEINSTQHYQPHVPESSGSRLLSRIEAPPPILLPTNKPSHQPWQGPTPTSKSSGLDLSGDSRSSKASSTTSSSESKLPKARKMQAPKQLQERGKRKPLDRTIHNASERKRRGNLNNRYQELAALLPSLSRVKRSSKPLIVNSALTFVEAALNTETLWRRNLEALSSENEILRSLLNEERSKSGLEPITSQIAIEIPRPLSEIGVGDEDGSQEGEGEFEERSPYDIIHRSISDEEGTFSSNGTTISDSQLEKSFNHQDWDNQSQFSDLTTPVASHFLRPPPHVMLPIRCHNTSHLPTPISGSSSNHFFQSPNDGFAPEELNQYATHRRSTLPMSFPSHFNHYSHYPQNL